MGYVFISYSQDSDAHKDRVTKLVERLRNDGVNVTFDRDMLPGGPAEGWSVWSIAQVKAGGKVLIVCTERYCARYEGTETPGVGCGATCEARAIHQILYDASYINDRFRAVLFSSSDEQHVPGELRDYHRYRVDNPASYNELVAWLKGEPAAVSNTVLASRAGIVWPALTTQYEWNIADRRDIFSALVQMLSGGRQRYLLLKGDSNVGKTWTLGEMDLYAQRHGIHCTLIDLKGCRTLEEIIGSLGSAFGSEILRRLHNTHGNGQTNSLIEDLQCQTSPVLLIFDTYEQATPEVRRWIEGQVLLRLVHAPAVVVVIAGKEVPDHLKYTWRSVAQYLQLGPIPDPSHWREYVERRYQFQAPEGSIEILTRATRGDPGLLSCLLENLVTSLRMGAGA